MDNINKYITIGAGWKKDNRITVKLNNGKWITIFKNQRKQKENQPDYNLTMIEHDAIEMGLEKNNYEKKENKNENDEEINIDDIPF